MKIPSIFQQLGEYCQWSKLKALEFIGSALPAVLIFPHDKRSKRKIETSGKTGPMNSIAGKFAPPAELIQKLENFMFTKILPQLEYKLMIENRDMDVPFGIEMFTFDTNNVIRVARISVQGPQDSRFLGCPVHLI